MSFLASCANATLAPEIKTYDEANPKARSASVYTPESRTNTTINQSLSNTHTVSDSDNTLVIGTGGTITISNAGSQAVNFQTGSSTTTFLNQGTLIGGSNTTSVNVENNNVTIETFNNQGIIGNGSSKFGVVVWGKATINNFNNSGTIHSNSGEAIYLGDTKVSTFNNSGTIKTNTSYGINIAYGTSIENFTNSGTIKSEGNNDILDNSSVGASSGLYIYEKTSIKNFTNTGLISGKLGVKLLGSTIENFINKGTIESTSNHSKGSAINFTSLDGTNSKISTLTNEGLIKSEKSNGIALGDGNEIGTFVNKGTIEAGMHGINFFTFDDARDYDIKVGAIILETGSSIKAGINGININDGGYEGPLSSNSIEVKQGAVISGGNAGIAIGGGKEINTQITIAGEVSGGAAGIVNEGIIGSSDNDDKKGGIIISGGSVSSSNGGSGIVNQGNGSIAGEIKVESGGSVEGGITNTGSGSISGNIVVEDGGKLDSITNTSTSDTGISGSITNNSDNKLEISNGEGATIGGGITNNGDADLVISNQGSVGKDENGNTVTNNGSGSVGIKDWVVSTDKETGKLDTIVVGGNGKDNVKVENITVDQSNVNLDELGNINNIISGVNQ
ncbi:TPA: beta strand repeat-containing protein, partial [Campylobacter jejuni]